MKVNLKNYHNRDNDDAMRLEEELNSYRAQGISITFEGQSVEIDRRFTGMLVRDGPCTFMRNYVFDSNGKTIEIDFERVKHPKLNYFS